METITSPPSLPAPRMDPRIRQRRIEVARYQGRRRLRILVVSLGVFGMITGIVVFLHSPLAQVRHLVLQGAQHTSVQEVVAATGLGGRPLMVSLDVAGVERKVKRLAWVDTASISRDWPSTVVVSLHERSAVGQVSFSGGKWALVDRTGRVLAAQGAPWPHQPALIGLGQPSRPGTWMASSSSPALVLASQLPTWLRTRVAEVQAQANSNLQLLLYPSGSAALGDDSNLAAKFNSLGTMLSQVPASGAIYNVTVPSAPALTR